MCVRMHAHLSVDAYRGERHWSSADGVQAGSYEPPDVGTGKPTGSSARIDALNC